VDFLFFGESEDVDVSASDVHWPDSMSLFTLDAPDLNRVVTTLEEQAEKSGRQLRRNRQLLDNRIRELRYLLERKDPSFARRAGTQAPPNLTAPSKGAIWVLSPSD